MNVLNAKKEIIILQLGLWTFSITKNEKILNPELKGWVECSSCGKWKQKLCSEYYLEADK